MMTVAKRLSGRPLLAILSALSLLIALYVLGQAFGDDGATSASDPGTSGTALPEPGAETGATNPPHEPGNESLPGAGADEDPDSRTPGAVR